MIRAAGYIRVSTDEQAEHGVSLPSQKSRIIAYCQSQNWSLHDLYVDDGYSGKDLNRPGMSKLIDDVKERKIDAIIVIKLDRLSRRQKDVLYLLEDVFEPNGIGFKSVSEPFDTTTPFGKAAIGMMAVFAQLERETIVERVRDGKKEAAKQGRFMGGYTPYGYKFNNKKLEINDLEAETVRLIFSEYLTSGKGYQHIADILNERHITTPGASPEWERGTVRAILKNSFYTGLIEHKGNMHKGQHAAIISEEDYFNALKIKSIRSTYDPETEHGLLTGIIYCGECGARMRKKKVWKNPRKPVLPKKELYICYSQDRSSPSMIRDLNCKCGYKPATEIDNAVIEYLHKYKQNPKLLKEITDNLLNSNTNKHIEKSKTQANKELNTIKAKLNKWYDAFENNIISADDLLLRIKDMKDQRTYLENKILDYDNTIKENIDKSIAAKEVINILKNFDEIWNNSETEVRRQILLGFVKMVTVDKNNNINISFI
jgi:site-specific DNA recombinase